MNFQYPKIINYLNGCLENNLLSHAYIFYGPDEDSKHEIVLWFANTILRNKNFKFHPDLFFIKPGFNEEISIDWIRQLKKFLTLRPYSSEFKIVIIETAEKLNSYAQNALLKIFEEAPNHAIIILCAKTLDSISDTIVSRAIKLPFWRVQTEVLAPDKTISDIFELLLKTDISNKYGCIEKLDSPKVLEIFKAWLNFLRIKFKANPTKKITNLLAK
ncbi:MAG: hypothetical protein Q8N43_03090, partial [Candidatus Azambacteria bacterium]|nr:hypothetical protein [Candidatus Azambacteria bacterium]